MFTWSDNPRLMAPHINPQDADAAEESGPSELALKVRSLPSKYLLNHPTAWLLYTEVHCC